MKRTILVRGLLALIFCGALVFFRSAPNRMEARIEFYRSRIGGPATYPAYTGLGAAYYLRARATGSAADYAEAERLLRQSLAFQQNQEAMKWLAATLADQHRFPEALSLSRQAVEAARGDQDARGILFDILLGMGNTTEALPVLEGMLANGPRFATGIREAAWYQSLGKFDAAAQLWDTACGLGEREALAAETVAWCYAQLGQVEQRRGDSKRAEQAFHRSLRFVPGYFLARQRLAQLTASSPATQSPLVPVSR